MLRIGFCQQVNLLFTLLNLQLLNRGTTTLLIHCLLNYFLEEGLSLRNKYEPRHVFTYDFVVKKKNLSWFRNQKRNYINKWAIIKLYNSKGLKGWNGVSNLHIMSPHAFLSSQIILLSAFSYFRGLHISGYSPTATARTPASTLSWQVKTETWGKFKEWENEVTVKKIIGK